MYVKRLMESALEINLKTSGCVLVTGPKFSGKSTMCAHYAKSTTDLNLSSNINLVSSDPRIALEGDTPHLIDEWQKVPEIWNYIKVDLDRDYKFGKYIITGSTTPLDPSKIQHSGAGRIAPMVLKPFTLFESGESLGNVSLSSLFKGDETGFNPLLSGDNPYTIKDIAFMLCRGGWPISLQAEKEFALKVTSNYYKGLFTIENESDDFVYFLKDKNIELLKLILKSYAKNVSSQAKKTKMAASIVESGFRSSLDDNTFSSYEKTLKDLYIIYDMPAWNFNLRSSAIIRSSPTHHFVDTSIAACALGITPADLLNDFKTFGLFFEDMAVRDLSVYSSTIEAELKHYRDSSGQEVDAIIELPNGDYGAIEIKIASPHNIEEAAKSLNKFEQKVRLSKPKMPKFKMILTSHGDCYKRSDGIYVVPLTCLKN